MTVRDLERLYDYGYWVNRRLFPIVTQLTTEEFTRAVAGSYGSVRNTMVHTLSAEWGWMDRCGGPARGPALKADDFPDPQSVVSTWTRVEEQMRAFLSTLSDADISRPIQFTLPGQPACVMALGELLHHGANHGVHHRGQVALLLRQLGKTPGNFDLLFYYAEKPLVAHA